MISKEMKRVLAESSQSPKAESGAPLRTQPRNGYLVANGSGAPVIQVSGDDERFEMKGNE